MDRSMIPEWIILNNQIIDENGEIKSLNKDKDAVRSYFLNYVNKKTQFFHSLEEKIEYLIENEYYESRIFKPYTMKQIHEVYT